jgi:two-component system NtrC family sensor kinase
VWNRISYKLIVATGGVAFAIITVFAYLMLDAQRQQLLAEVERNANQLSDTIKSSTHHDMLLNRSESVHRIINTIGAQEGIEKVRIFNKEGEIILSTDPGDLGQMVDQHTEACDMCHAADKPLERVPASERTRIFTAASGTRTFGIINPIYNEPSCWQNACHAHDEGQKVLGVLDISMSLEEVESSIQAGRMRLLTFALIAIAAISLIINWLVKQIVLKPVGEIAKATRKVAEGDLTHSIVTIDKDDEIGRLAASFNVMTEKLAEAQRQLLQSDKLASLGRLAAGVAHEINNPLTGVLTYSSFLLKNAEETPELKEDLEVIVRETKRCREIVKGLLDFSRQSASTTRPTPVNEIVRNACRIVEHQLSIQKVRIDTQLPKESPVVNADMMQMEHVLVNLLLNAADAIGEAGGTITIDTKLATAADGINGRESPQRMARIRVTDTGCGIPAEGLNKLFEPFYSTKGAKGTGLGLAIVWGIIEKHQGQIKVDSEVGRGTTLTILLPVAKSAGAI